MKKIVLFLVVLFLSISVMASDRYLLLGIDNDATVHDKLELLRVINKYLDSDYTASMPITFYKISNPANEWLLGCWDVGGRKFPFTKAQALNYFTAHASDFDDVTMIKLVGSDNPMATIAGYGFARKE